MTVPTVPMTEPEPIQRTIARIRRSGKWMEFWFVENEGDFSRRFDDCEKAGTFHELLEEGGAAAEWMDNHGAAGLITTWRGQRLVAVHLPFAATPSPVLSNEDLWNLARRQARLVKATDWPLLREWRTPETKLVASVRDMGEAAFEDARFSARIFANSSLTHAGRSIHDSSLELASEWVEEQLQSLGYTILKETPCP